MKLQLKKLLFLRKPELIVVLFLGSLTHMAVASSNFSINFDRAAARQVLSLDLNHKIVVYDWQNCCQLKEDSHNIFEQG